MPKPKTKKIHFPDPDNTHLPICGHRNHYSTPNYSLTHDKDKITCLLCRKKLVGISFFSSEYDAAVVEMNVSEEIRSTRPDEPVDILNPTRAQKKRAEKVGKLLSDAYYRMWEVQ